MYDFDEIVQSFKDLRIKHQQIPVPLPYPPHLVCYDGETVVCQVATPTPEPHSIAAMLSSIAVCHADLAVLSMESTVRAIDPDSQPTDAPLGQDPKSVPGLLTVAAQKNGQDISVDAFAVDDEGDITWIPGLWWSPLTGMLVGAMHEVFEAEVPNSVADFVIWMQMNRFGIKVHPSLYQQPDDD